MKTTALVAALLLACLPLTANAAQRTVRVTVPGGTQVPVKVLGSVSSGSAKAGDIFPVQAAEDVIVHGMVVVAAGARGQGTIQQVDGAGGNGHSGTLALNFDWVYAVDGGKIRLSNTPTKPPRKTGRVPHPRPPSSASQRSASAVSSATISPTAKMS